VARARHERAEHVSRPIARSVFSRNRSSASRSVARAANPVASPPPERMLATISRTAASSRPLTTTFAALAASIRQVAAPVPRELPVTTVTWPARSGYVGIVKVMSLPFPRGWCDR
jgi:hypothetical protein